MFPSLPFILIGDSGQQDPETYRDLIHEFPDRVLSVYIRNLKRDPLRAVAIRDLADEVESAGSSLVLADDTLAAARHAVGNGWIAPDALDHIAGDSEVDRWRTVAHQRERTAVIDDHA
jgi:phosphatidate phosphatase APP1